MADLYRDKQITCTEDAIVVRWYYLWGTKRIQYSAIKAARLVMLSPLRGKGRIWGTANPQYWASLDPGRPRKSAAIIVDTGGAVKPYLTPDDPEAVAAIVKDRAGLADVPMTGRGPLL
jgi:hypothetical protein